MRLAARTEPEHTGGIAREMADHLGASYLRHAPTPTETWIGQTVPRRNRIRAGSPGSALFVWAIMGERYLEWVSSLT